MDTSTKYILAFAAGAAIGASAMYMYSHEKHKKLLAEEVESIRMAYKRSERIAEKQAKKEEKARAREPDLSIPYKDLTKPYQSHLVRDVEDIRTPQSWAEAMIERPEKSYVITTDEYVEDRLDYDNLDLTYFHYDNTVCDENEEIVPDISSLVIPNFKELFGCGSQDPDIVYFRNNKRGCDIQLTRLWDSYQSVVLGIPMEGVEEDGTDNKS